MKLIRVVLRNPQIQTSKKNSKNVSKRQKSNSSAKKQGGLKKIALNLDHFSHCRNKLYRNVQCPTISPIGDDCNCKIILVCA